MTDITITALQRDALHAAAVRNDGTIFPVRSKPNLNAGSAAKLVRTLIAKGLAEERIAEGRIPAWRTSDVGQRLAAVITDAGLDAIGMLPAGKAGGRPGTVGRKAAVAAKQGVVAVVSRDEPRRPRPGTKLAMLVGLLEREEGATIAELSETVGWMAHSTRGVLSGMLQKKFGLVIASETIAERGRVYRLRS